MTNILFQSQTLIGNVVFKPSIWSKWKVSNFDEIMALQQSITTERASVFCSAEVLPAQSKVQSSAETTGTSWHRSHIKHPSKSTRGTNPGNTLRPFKTEQLPKMHTKVQEGIERTNCCTTAIVAHAQHCSVLYPTVHKTAHTKIKKKNKCSLLWSAIDTNNNKYNK